MKQKWIVFTAVCMFSSMLNAQQGKPSLSTMLNDANYTFNRYEEMMPLSRCDWLNVASLAKQCRELTKTSAINIASGKAALNRALKTNGDPSLLDLFDIYSELMEASDQLSEFASQLAQFSREDGMPYAQAGAKGMVLAARMGLVVRNRIALSCH